MKALTMLVKSFPSRMAEYLPQILDPVWLALTHNAKTYPIMFIIICMLQPFVFAAEGTSMAQWAPCGLRGCKN